jgi:hypothetical protein
MTASADLAAGSINEALAANTPATPCDHQRQRSEREALRVRRDGKRYGGEARGVRQCHRDVSRC